MKKFKAFNPDFVNTSEAYSKRIFIGRNNVIIPYINIGLMPDNPINNKQSVVDYSYCLLENVSRLVFKAGKGEAEFGFGNAIDSGNDLIDYISVGGFNGENEAEVAVFCKGIFLFFHEEARIEEPAEPFVPFDTPRFKRNLNLEQVNSFFLEKTLPDDIRKLLGDSVYSFEWR